MSGPERPWWEQVAVVVETLGALVACALIVSCPLWGTVLLILLGLPGLGTFSLSVLTAALVLWPALRPVPGDPQLNAYQRWGTNWGRLLRAPIQLVKRRQRKRGLRSLGASSSSAAAPSSAER